MSEYFTDLELEAYLDEALPADLMTSVESALRTDATLAQRLVTVHQRRDSGVHSLGEIWRRHRVTCPSREQLGAFLLKAVDPDLADYVQFHVQQVGCRYCEANLQDLGQRHANSQAQASQARRRR